MVSVQMIDVGTVRAGSVKWQRVVLQPDGPSTQVVSAVRIAAPPGGSPVWILGGATAAAPPERAPAVWVAVGLNTSSNAGFERVPMAAFPGYGEIAEIFGVAGHDIADVADASGADVADAGDIAAIGQAFGGAHGNPRTASWDGSAAGLSEVRANFELYNGPRQIAVRGITHANGRYVIIGSRVNRNGRLGAAAWTSADGAEFALHDDEPALFSAPNEQVQGLAITRGSSNSGPVFIAAGERLWWDPANSADTIGTDAVLWRSADGVSWERWSPKGFVLGGPGEQRITAVHVSGDQFVAAGTDSVNGTVRVVFWSSAGKRVIKPFAVNDDPLSAVTSVARVGEWWVVGARMAGVLKLAASRDGRVWRSIPLPFRDVPTGGRARIVVLPDTGRTLLIGLSGLDGGGLWERPLCGAALLGAVPC